MKVVSPKKRIMADEFLAKGVVRKTGEIRKTYDLLTLRSNFTYIPENETQRPHRHFLVIEAVHVLAGELQVHCEGKWQKIVEDEIALFDLSELHNVRTTKVQQSVVYPGVTKNTAAVAIVYKWIPPFLTIYEDEITFIIQNDWFNNNYEDKDSDPKTSPVLRLDKNLQDKFWEIVTRNNMHIRNRVT